MTAAVHPDRNFKYWLVAPAIFLLLLIGLFPLIYSLVVSFMRIDMMDTDTSFAGLYNYANLFKDSRLWWSLAHTLLITAIALPIELILGLAMAYLFLERMPGRQLFVALLVLPTIISASSRAVFSRGVQLPTTLPRLRIVAPSHRLRISSSLWLI